MYEHNTCIFVIEYLSSSVTGEPDSSANPKKTQLATLTAGLADIVDF